MAGAFARDEHGATVVEFALVSPVLLLALVACCDFARALNAYVTVANAAREGARYASITNGATSSSVQTYLATRVAPLNPSPPAMVVTLASPAPTSVRWSPDAPAPKTFTVTVTYEWRSSTWLIGSFLSTASGSTTFGSSSSMESVR
ncbi:MAG TPA: TadE/TadG family type IV pilus assembly protein [Candidatus Limnocylindria bacterium]